MGSHLIGVTPRNHAKQSISSLDSRLFAYLSLYIPLKDKCSKLPRLSRSINQLYQFVQRDVTNSFVHDRLQIDGVVCAVRQSHNQSLQPKCKFIPHVGTLIGDESKIEFRAGTTQYINQAINQPSLHSLGWSYGPLKSTGSLPALISALKQSDELSHSQSINQSISQSNRQLGNIAIQNFNKSINQSFKQSIKICNLSRLDLRLTCDLEQFRSIDWAALKGCTSLQVLFLSLPPVVRDRYADFKLLAENLPPSITDLGIHVGDWAWNSAFKNHSVLPHLKRVRAVNYGTEQTDMRICAELATTRMSETEKIRPLQSIDTRLIDDTDIRYLSAFDSLTVLNATLMPDRLIALTRIPDSSLAHLQIVRLQVPLRARLPPAYVDPAPLLLFLARRPICELMLTTSSPPVDDSSECNMQQINDAGLKALVSMKLLRKLVLLLPTRSKRLFSSDDIGRFVTIGCWPDMHTLHLKPDIPVLPPQVECLLRGAPHLKDLMLSASSTCLAKIAMHGRQLVRVELCDRRRDPKSPVSVNEMQHAFSMAAINHSSFPCLFMLKLFDRLSPTAFHFLLSHLRYAPRLRYFIDSNGLPPLLAEKEVFHVAMTSVLPHLDSIVPERYSKAIQLLFKRATYSTSDFIEIAHYNRTSWTFGTVDESMNWSEDLMLHEIHQSTNGVYCRFKQLSDESDFHHCNGRESFYSALTAKLSKSDHDRLALWDSGNYSSGSWQQQFLAHFLDCTPFLSSLSNRNVKKVLPAARARTAQMTRIM